MTAISDAIMELEAQRERIGILITELRRHEHAIESTYLDPAATKPRPRYAPAGAPSRVSQAVDALADVSDLKRTMQTAERNVAGFSAADQHALGALNDDARKVLKLVASVQDPISTKEVQQGTRLPIDRVRVALQALVREGNLVATGATSARRYAAKLRPGSAAGTPSGPAGGSGPGHRRDGQPEFETVWNGTKERNGQAPCILPPRERKP